MTDDRIETSTDAFLLTLDEPAFVDVGALIALRARVTAKCDTDLVDAFLGGNDPFARPRRPMLVTSLPSLRPH
jgi:hypothetical protein